MLDGLRAFGRYVPRTLVMKLVKEGRLGSGTEERVLAIMFTDIVSFTSTCEKMSATGVAEFINQHLSLVSSCVEQEGGIDLAQRPATGLRERDRRKVSGMGASSDNRRSYDFGDVRAATVTSLTLTAPG